MPRRGAPLTSRWYASKKLKIAAAIFHASHCKNHVVMTDDDVYFWVEKVEKFVKNAWNDGTVESRGHVRFRDNIVRLDSIISKLFAPKAEKRYEISRSMFAPNRVPPYFIGAGYLISYQAILKISNYLDKVSLLWQVDDAYFGLLLHDAGIKLIDDQRFISYEEHALIQSSKGQYRPSLNFRKYQYRCDTFNFHGYRVDKDFLYLRNQNGCGSSSNEWFKMTPNELEKFKIDF